MKVLYQIKAPHFTVGLQVEDFDHTVVFAPPIVRYMKDWTVGEVEDYCWKKKWKLEEVKQNP